jgi:hypothetical protein
MPESAIIAQFERRLAEIGCPAARLHLGVQELSDHHEDLKCAGLEEGLSEAEAEARADELLGDPANLAAEISAVVRHCSWVGRHPVIAFCLLPAVMVLVTTCIGLGLAIEGGELYFTSDELALLRSDRAGALLGDVGLQGTWCVTALLTAWIFCVLARRSARGLKWGFAACVACSVYSCCLGIQFNPRSLTFYCHFPPNLLHPNWAPFLAPLAVAVIAWWRKRRQLQRFAALCLANTATVPSLRSSSNAQVNRSDAMNAEKKSGYRTAWLTPSSLVAALCVIAVVAFGFWVRSIVARDAARYLDRVQNVWPAERAAVAKELRLRQAASVASGAVTVSLNQWLNASLEDSLAGMAETNHNDLHELPVGFHIFGGIPFDVQGRLQLAGRKLLETTTAFPVRTRGIKIGKKCSRIHLLHGAGNLAPELGGTNIANLVARYTDGSQARISLVAGRQLMDWWGPIYNTAAGPAGARPSAPGSELAWVGSNPWLKSQHPHWSLRLYKSSFDNPHPDREISSVDYVSTMTDAAPFLVGLTVE